MTSSIRVPTVPPEIEAKRDEIESLCRRFGVVRLDLFGSAATGRYDPFTSDYDFLVTYPSDYDFGPWYGRFQDLRQELAWLLRSNVDLVSLDNVQSPTIRAGIERSRVTLYNG